MLHIIDTVKAFWVSLQTGMIPGLGTWNYFILAALVAIEGPIATLLGAAAASAGFLRIPLVFLAAACGNLLADTLWYSLGFSGKIEWIYRLGRPFGVRQKHLERLQKNMHTHATGILLVAKLTAGFIIPSLIAAGLARVPLRRWFPVICAAEMVWTGSLVLIGYSATEAIRQVERGLEYWGLFTALIFVLVLPFLLRKAIRKKNAEDKMKSKEDTIDQDR